MDRLRMALSGVGGFGATHVRAAEQLEQEGLVKVVAFAEPNANAPAVATLRDREIRWYRDYRELLTTEQELDLVTIATPIHTHVPMATEAFERGLHVFLEKPPAVQIQDLRRLIALEERHDRFCAVGFHDVARPAAIALKRRLCEDTIGTVKAIHAHARWRRADTYYRRNGWAGKTQVDGAYVLDGPMNNACAHVLNMASYLAGAAPHEFARPLWVQGELYRAMPIDGEDTNCLRAGMDTGVDVCIHLTQAASKSWPRAWKILGSDGTAEFDDVEGVRLPGGHIPQSEPENFTLTLLRRLVEVVLGSDEPLLMPLAETEGFLLLSNGAYESAGHIATIPEECITKVAGEDGTSWVVESIDDVMAAAANEGKLLSECGLPWGRPSEPFDLAGYKSFPQRWTSGPPG